MPFDRLNCEDINSLQNDSIFVKRLTCEHLNRLPKEQIGTVIIYYCLDCGIVFETEDNVTQEEIEEDMLEAVRLGLAIPIQENMIKNA